MFSLCVHPLVFAIIAPEISINTKHALSFFF